MNSLSHETYPNRNSTNDHLNPHQNVMSLSIIPSSESQIGQSDPYQNFVGGETDSYHNSIHSETHNHQNPMSSKTLPHHRPLSDETVSSLRPRSGQPDPHPNYHTLIRIPFLVDHSTIMMLGKVVFSDKHAVSVTFNCFLLTLND